MLDIQDLDKLKITKIKNWCVYFEYGIEKYLLHGSSEYGEYGIDLYRRHVDEYGRWELEEMSFMESNATNGCLCFIKDCRTKKTIVYSHVDKEYFVKKMSWHGLCTCLFDEELKVKKEKIESYRAKSACLNSEISNISAEIRKEENFN